MTSGCYSLHSIRYDMSGIYRNVILFSILPSMDVDDDAIKKTKFLENMRHLSIHIVLYCVEDETTRQVTHAVQI